ncbi:MAG: threonine--tRNA ligase, partial [Rhodospirillales bacterium]|nr:threonine--tRNA ligase [Rhodospirillales bacterium]
DDYAAEVAAALKQAGLAVELDTSNQKIQAKIRDHSLHHVPNILVVGRKEAEERKVAIRRLGGAAQEIMSLEDAIAALKTEATPPDLRS